jgi:PAS domain S-box-containing protein
VSDPLRTNGQSPQGGVYTPPHPLPSFINQIEDGYYEANLAGAFVYVNDALCRLSGYSREELLSADLRRYTKHTDARTAERLKSAFQLVYQTGQSIGSLEITMTQRDGTPLHIDISVALIQDDQGKACGFRGFVRDITTRRAMDNALRARIQMLSLLQQVDKELADAGDPETVLTIAMNSAIALSRADAGFVGVLDGERIRICRAYGVTGERELDLNEGVIGRALRNGRPEFVEDVYADPDYIGDVPGMYANIVLPLHARERMLGVINLETRYADLFTPEVYEFTRLLAARVASALDNTMLLHTSQAQLAALQKLYVQVSELEKIKTDMIRIAAHDMRSPLSIIASYIEMLRDELAPHLDEGHAAYFAAIDRSLDRMNRLSTDILSLEKINERRTAPTKLIDFARVMHETAVGFRLEADERRLDYQIAPFDGQCMVAGDALELGEALSNLISNALKYTPSGGKVVVSGAVQDERAIVEVRDTGFGVPYDQQKLLFKPFSRIRTQQTINIAGTGLGLHLVRKIVERHQGELIFESEPDVGSRFGFSLPLAQRHSP